MDKIIVAASTHWDREWYRTFQEFQIRLCDLMNQLIDLLEKDEAFLCYTFDGQSVVLDDYLEIYPENKERIKKLVKEKKLVFGPLYNLPDEFLSGGEALIRNFLMGDLVCKEIGGKMKAGYVPDNFGHISQLPQILQGVGLDNAFFFRGTNVNTIGAKEFYWEGPDGSKVLAEYMLLGYWSLKSWGKMEKSTTEHFFSAYETLKEYSKLNVFLLTNGSDHLYQDPDFTAMLQEVKDAFPQLEIENASIEDYANMARTAATKKELPLVKGELRDFRYGPDPTAVTSTRNELKRLLFDTLEETQRYAEPLCTIAATLDSNYVYPTNFFRKIWKKILVSLGHDGITGCSTDEVMNDIKMYLTHANEMASRLSTISFEQIIKTMGLWVEKEEDVQGFAMFNPQPFPFSGITEQIIAIEKGEKYYKDFTIYDDKGREVPYEIIDVWEDIITKEFLYNSKEKVNRTCIKVRMEVKEVAALGISVYKIKKHILLEKREQEFYIRGCASNEWIENEFYKITVNGNGSVNVYDKKQKQQFEEFNLLVARGEAGDEYQHVSPLLDQHVFPRLEQVVISENTRLSKTLLITTVMHLPKARSNTFLAKGEGSEILRLKTEITLYRNTDRIEFHMEGNNPCADFILYTKFPTPFEKPKEYSYVSFDEVERDNQVHPFDSNLKSTQSFLKPMQHYGGIRGENGSFHVMTKGLYEYHTKAGEEGLDFYLTLLRSTSYLFHGLPISWLDGQHSTTPIVETPDAKGIGKFYADYAICFNKECIGNAAQEYVYPLKGYNIASAEDSHNQKLSFLEVDEKQMKLSALKFDESNQACIVRIYQVSEKPVTANLRFWKEIKACHYCNLLEEPYEQAEFTGNTIQIEVPAKKIITLRIQWSETI